MKTQLIAICSTLFGIIVCDAVWLSSTITRFYRPRIGHLMADSANFIAAGFFYLVYTLGLVFFVVSPAIRERMDFPKIFLSGAILGLVAYGTYDLTNHATLKNWPRIITLVDMVWGMVMTGSVGVVAVWVARRI